MRFGSLGLPELLLLALVILLLWRGRGLPSLGRRLGERARKPFRQAGWICGSLAGSKADALRAEEQFGSECAREFSAQFPGEVAPDRQDWVAATGSRLADALADERRRFTFRAVAAPAANAFALPGGFVFVTGALLDLYAGCPDELAFVLGHEMGHVVKSHARDRLMAELVFDLLGRRAPGAGRVVRDLLGKGYAREQELEADRAAVRLLSTAGFDAGGALRALQRLEQLGPDRAGLAEYFSTHPSLAERVRALRDAACGESARAD